MNECVNERRNDTGKGGASRLGHLQGGLLLLEVCTSGVPSVCGRESSWKPAWMGAWGGSQGALFTPPFCSGTHWSLWGWEAVSREQCLQLETKAMAAVRLARQARVVEPAPKLSAATHMVSRLLRNVLGKLGGTG